jgi:dipeptidase
MAAVQPATSGGVVLFGKNSDREFTEAQYLQWLPAARHEAGARVRLTYKDIEQARETYAVMLSKPHWIWGAEIGANEHGLVIGNEALFSKIDASLEPGIIGMDFLRLALERARDVDEGVSVITSLLREHGQSGNCGFKREMAYHNSFILADPRGARVLETVEREWVVTPIKDYYAISNAMTVETGFAACSPTLESRAVSAGIHQEGAAFAFKSVYEAADKVASGCFRRARAMELLGARSGRLAVTDFFSVLRDHKEGERAPGRSSGPRICAHTRENPLGQTTASWVASLEPSQRMHWVTGTAAPCTGLFKPVLLEAGLPAHGTPPAGEEDNTSLWWRHEKLTRYLDGSQEAVRHAFTGERDALEARFLDRMSTCPAASDPQGRDEARRLTESCWREGVAFENRWLDKAGS